MPISDAAMSNWADGCEATRTAVAKIVDTNGKKCMAMNGKSGGM